MDKIRQNRATIIVIAILLVMVISTALYTYMLTKDQVRPGGYSEEWNWGRKELNKYSINDLKVAIQALLLSLLFIAISLAAYFKTSKARFFVLPLTVFFSCYIFLGITIETIYYGFYRVPIIIVNNGLTGYFENAIKLGNPISLFSGFEHIHESLIGHSRSHPPGGILFFWLILHAVKSFGIIGKIAMEISEVLQIDYKYLMSIDPILQDPTNYKAAVISGFILPFSGFLAVIPLYQVGKVLFSQKVGIIAVLLSMVVPSYMLISPQIDQFYLLLAMSFLAFYLTGIKRNSVLLPIISAGLLVIAYFLSIALALLLPIAFLLSVFMLSQNNEDAPIFGRLVQSAKKALFDRSLWILTGTTALCLIIFAFMKINTYAITMSLLRFNAGFNKEVNGIGRSYDFWLLNNLYDYFFFLGLPVAIMFFAVFFFGKDVQARNGRLYASIILIFVLLLDISGINRAEVARLWMFLMPLFVIGAAVVSNTLAEHSKSLLIVLVIIVVSLQTAQSASYGIYLTPYAGPGLPYFEDMIVHRDLKSFHFLIP